jgi:hypothetical protein
MNIWAAVPIGVLGVFLLVWTTKTWKGFAVYGSLLGVYGLALLVFRHYSK